MTKDNGATTRRGFLRFIQSLFGATAMAAILGPIISFFWPGELEEIPSEPIAVGSPDDIAPGEGIVVRFGRYPALVIHTQAGLRAYSAVCTHFACICKWNPESGMIECPCHEGYFDPVDGAVISGPPPRPLDSIPIHIENDTLFIGGEA